MIVQTVSKSSTDAPHFIIAMHQHTTFAGMLAANYGNHEFVGLEPAEPMQFVVDHHDEGWSDLDASAPQDPTSGLPYNLTQTPLPQIISTSAGSPAFNETHHPFSGIISSMHTYGLYHGRYGLSDKIFLNSIPTELRSQADTMLATEQARQARLTTKLKETNPEYASREFLFHAYKQLQFFDTLSLYMHMSAPGTRGVAEFHNVPRNLAKDVTITVRELPNAVYEVDPYPFTQDNLELSTKGCYLQPQPAGTNLAALIADAPIDSQTVHLVRA